MRLVAASVLLLAACDRSEPPPSEAADQTVASMVAERDRRQEERFQSIEREQRRLRDEMGRLRATSGASASDRSARDDWAEFREKGRVNDRLESLERNDFVRGQP